MGDLPYRDLDERIFADLLRNASDNPVAVFEKLLTERLEPLEAAFDIILSDSGICAIEAILTWCNCPSLTAAAARYGIPVVHLELGPLRWPDYRPTAYLDFSGVNGNSEASSRYCAVEWAMDGIDTGLLRRFFAADANEYAPPPDFDIGIPLQVEDDSNLIAFGRGFDNQSLLALAQLRHSSNSVLVRGHPGSVFGVRPAWYRVDESAGSVAFIRRCRKIITINSSVGFEALLLGKEVDMLGECSYRFIGEAENGPEMIRRLAFYLFAYLVPFDLVYSSDYIRFRLTRPGESAIVARHLAAYGVASADSNSRCGDILVAALAIK
jgi:hypothetical protein